MIRVRRGSSCGSISMTSKTPPPHEPVSSSNGDPTAATAEIPLARPYLGKDEEESVMRVLETGRLALGPAVELFEEAFAQRVGAPYAAAVSSGTAGLHLLAHLAGVGPDNEVITSPFSFVASANCAIYEGATPVFADIDARSLNLDPQAVEEAVTERTRAIVAVDILGLPCEIDDLRSIADRHGLAFIEDACEALGAEYKGSPIGSHGVPAVFGFYPNKQITTGEGGVVVTHDEEHWKLLKSLSNQGRSQEEEPGEFSHQLLGWNYRLSDTAAAIGVAQLEKFDEMQALRAEAADRYAALLDFDRVELLCSDDQDHRRSWFAYVIKLDIGIDRAHVVQELKAQKIATACYFPVIHLQQYMRDRYAFSEGLCPIAEDISNRTLALPFYPEIGEQEQERVAGALRTAIGQR